MEALVRLFRERTPAKLLDEHRCHIRQCVLTLCELPKPITRRMREYVLIGCEGEPFEELIATGSCVEGASLARFFSTDNVPTTEIEFDLMISYGVIGKEALMQYAERNKAFVHIKLNQSEFEETIRKCSLGLSTCLFVYKGNETYVSCSLLKQKIAEQLNSGTGNNSMGFRILGTEGKGASIPVTVDYENVSEESIYGNEAAHQRQLYAHMKPYFELFQNKLPEMMSRLETIQREFTDIRRQRSTIPLGAQAAKALEWAMLCIEINDLVFECRKDTCCYYLKFMYGQIFESMEDEQRLRNYITLKPYIERLTVSDSELSNETIAATVQQTLDDVDRFCLVERSVEAFRKYGNLDRKFEKMTRSGTEHLQVHDIALPLQRVGNKTKETSMDLAICMKLAFWPSVASEWRMRQRLWPEQSVVDEIVNSGVHVVSKTFCHDDIDWRLSFSVAEINLATRWSPAQHFVYFIFKALFYRFIKPLSTSDGGGDSQQQSCGGTSAAGGAKSKYLTSYIMKTVMMQTSESFEQSWWTEDDAAECLVVLLLVLQSAFECRILSHYFLPSLNLLDGLSDALANIVIEKVSWILRNSTEVAEQMECHFATVQTYFEGMSAQSEDSLRMKLLSQLMESWVSG